MSRGPESEKFHPRSPVQPGTSPAPYFIIALLAAIVVWTFVQYGTGDWSWTSHLPFRSAPPQANPAHAGRDDLRTLFSADDYPAAAMKAGDQGTVRAQLTVDAEGRVRHCAVIRSSGHRSLDDATCSILQRRARFTPARDAEGRPIGSLVMTPPVTWQLAQ